MYIVAAMSTSNDNLVKPEKGFELLPLVIAVTGHRDLVEGETEEIRKRVRTFLNQVIYRNPYRRVSVMSPLAEGADRLVAEEALALEMELIVPLPMPREIYMIDFESEDSLHEFDGLCAKATTVIELPIARKNTHADISEHGPQRDLQYAQMGVFLCAHCHILLALWDGKLNGDLGGTGQVVKFHHDDVMSGYSDKSISTQQMLVDDESDLVYHIVCSRKRDDGEPHEELKPLDWWWYTKDRRQPRSKNIPPQHRLIFRRSNEFSHDAMRFAEQIENEKYDLVEAEDLGILPDGIDIVNELFCKADWLAIRYQKKTLLNFRVAHVLSFLMGICFILFADFRTWPQLMFGFLLFFAITYLVQIYAKRKNWHRKYLDYRGLAEGLRVQFYWAAGGVAREIESKFAHDHFLQTQDPELGWIRNVMRVAGTRCDASPKGTKMGLKYVLREWIGDNSNGQLGYFRKKVAERRRQHKSTERLAKISLATTVIVVLIIAVGGEGLSDDLRNALWVFMGVILLAYGVRQSYGFTTAEKELIKQYEFMLRIFQNAERRLDDAEDNGERRQILTALGGSALDEHAEWILTQRERTPTEGDLWRVGG
jgi:fatty-acid desaturase